MATEVKKEKELYFNNRKAKRNNQRKNWKKREKWIWYT
jgi:hypothetical protein